MQQGAQAPVVFRVVQAHQHRVHRIGVLALNDKKADGLLPCQHLVQKRAAPHHGFQPVGVAVAALFHAEGGVHRHPVADKNTLTNVVVHRLTLRPLLALHHGKAPVKPGDDIRHMVIIPAHHHMKDGFHKGIAQFSHAKQQLRAVDRHFQRHIPRPQSPDAFLLPPKGLRRIAWLQSDFVSLHPQVFTLPVRMNGFHPAPPRFPQARSLAGRRYG